MRLARRSIVPLLFTALVAPSCGGGGDGGTEPPTVASVLITAPAAPPSFATLTRTVQFSAVARDASSATIAGATITWNSTNTAAATVSGSGLVTAVGNGTTTITANSGGIASTGVLVTVAQVVANVNVTPGTVAFGAIGSTRQLTAAIVDSANQPVAGVAAATWTRAGTGATATVSGTGLVTATAVGASDTAVATSGTKTGRVPIAVTQVVATVQVSPTGTDTLRTTGRQKQYTAVARDSQANAMGATITWSSSVPGVASVDAGTGLATAVADGSTNIVATANTITGQRALVVRRFAANFSMTPPTATITTANGTQIFLGTAEDSVPTNLPITWVSRTTSVLTLAPGTGTQTTATAQGNGTSYVVMSAGTRSDSALVTVSGQAQAPLTATVNVGAGNIFTSVLNNSVNPAVDTIRVGGSITWQGIGGNHTVQSQGSPSFTSSGTLGTGTYVFTFNAAGTYQYDCAIHGNQMTGRIVVR